MIKFEALCIILAGWSHSADHAKKRATEVCTAVAIEATKQQVPVDEALALAWAESRFTPTVNRRTGAKGPMQVLPKWWCPKPATSCDYVEAGVRALKTFKKLFPGFKNAVCHYNSGVEPECPARSESFAEAVEVQRVKIKRQLMRSKIGAK